MALGFLIYAAIFFGLGIALKIEGRPDDAAHFFALGAITLLVAVAAFLTA